MSLNLGCAAAVEGSSNEVNGDIDMKNFRITQVTPATDDNHLINKKYATDKFARKEKYRLNATMVWYYATAGGNPVALNSNAYPTVPISKDTMVRILCHTFDKDGVIIPGKVKVTYKLYYITERPTQEYELLGTLQLKQVDVLVNGYWFAPVNHDFFVSDTISAAQVSKKPVGGFCQPDYRRANQW